MKDLGQKLKDLRLEKGLTQAEVSKKLGLTRTAIANYELGIREPSLEILKKICKFFEVSSDFLLGLEKE
ncbi:MAG: helix-turn-helix domain-containing protein [Clostridia bacterium]|nr:helix-turn-helix domain-containing protein [Clostridia bacterium]